MSLRSLRIRAGLSQRALAAKAGVHWTTVTDIERQRTAHPHPRIRYALAKALGVDMADVREFASDIRNGDPPPAAPGG